MWGLPGYSFLLSFCFVFYVINMKENRFIKLLFSQNKPFPQNISTADFYSPFSSVKKPHLSLYSIVSSDSFCKLSSISEITEVAGFIVVLSKQQLCFHAIKNYINYNQLEVKVKIFTDF